MTGTADTAAPAGNRPAPPGNGPCSRHRPGRHGHVARETARQQKNVSMERGPLSVCPDRQGNIPGASRDHPWISPGHPEPGNRSRLCRAGRTAPGLSSLCSFACLSQRDDKAPSPDEQGKAPFSFSAGATSGCAQSGHPSNEPCRWLRARCRGSRSCPCCGCTQRSGGHSHCPSGS